MAESASCNSPEIDHPSEDILIVDDSSQDSSLEVKNVTQHEESTLEDIILLDDSSQDSSVHITKVKTSNGTNQNADFGLNISIESQKKVPLSGMGELFSSPLISGPSKEDHEEELDDDRLSLDEGDEDIGQFSLQLNDGEEVDDDLIFEEEGPNLEGKSTSLDESPVLEGDAPDSGKVAPKAWKTCGNLAEREPNDMEKGLMEIEKDSPMDEKVLANAEYNDKSSDLARMKKAEINPVQSMKLSKSTRQALDVLKLVTEGEAMGIPGCHRKTSISEKVAHFDGQQDVVSTAGCAVASSGIETGGNYNGLMSQDTEKTSDVTETPAESETRASDNTGCLRVASDAMDNQIDVTVDGEGMELPECLNEGFAPIDGQTAEVALSQKNTDSTAVSENRSPVYENKPGMNTGENPDILECEENALEIPPSDVNIFEGKKYQADIFIKKEVEETLESGKNYNRKVETDMESDGQSRKFSVKVEVDIDPVVDQEVSHITECIKERSEVLEVQTEETTGRESIETEVYGELTDIENKIDPEGAEIPTQSPGGSDLRGTPTELVREQEAKEIASSLLLNFDDDADDKSSEEDDSWFENYARMRNKRLEERSRNASEDEDIEPDPKRLKPDDDEKDQSTVKLTAAQRLLQKFNISNPTKSNIDTGKKSGKEKSKEQPPRSLVSDKGKCAKRKLEPPFQLAKERKEVETVKKAETVKKPEVGKKPEIKKKPEKGNKPEIAKTSKRKTKLPLKLRSVSPGRKVETKKPVEKIVKETKNKIEKQSLATKKVVKKSPLITKAKTAKQECTSQDNASQSVYQLKANNLKEPLEVPWSEKRLANNNSIRLPEKTNTNSIKPVTSIKAVTVAEKRKKADTVKTPPEKKMKLADKAKRMEELSRKDKTTRVSVKIICEKGPASTKMTPNGIINRVEKAVQICTVRKKIDDAAIYKRLSAIAIPPVNENTDSMTERERKIQSLKDQIKKHERDIERINVDQDCNKCNIDDGSHPVDKNATAAPNKQKLMSMNPTNIANLRSELPTYTQAMLDKQIVTLQTQNAAMPTMLTIQGSTITPKQQMACNSANTSQHLIKLNTNTTDAVVKPKAGLPITGASITPAASGSMIKLNLSSSDRAALALNVINTSMPAKTGTNQQPGVISSAPVGGKVMQNLDRLATVVPPNTNTVSPMISFNRLGTTLVQTGSVNNGAPVETSSAQNLTAQAVGSSNPGGLPIITNVCSLAPVKHAMGRKVDVIDLEESTKTAVNPSLGNAPSQHTRMPVAQSSKTDLLNAIKNYKDSITGHQNKIQQDTVNQNTITSHQSSILSQNTFDENTINQNTVNQRVIIENRKAAKEAWLKRNSALSQILTNMKNPKSGPSSNGTVKTSYTHTRAYGINQDSASNTATEKPASSVTSSSQPDNNLKVNSSQRQLLQGLVSKAKTLNAPTQNSTKVRDSNSIKPSTNALMSMVPNKSKVDNNLKVHSSKRELLQGLVSKTKTWSVPSEGESQKSEAASADKCLKMDGSKRELRQGLVSKTWNVPTENTNPDADKSNLKINSSKAQLLENMLKTLKSLKESAKDSVKDPKVGPSQDSCATEEPKLVNAQNCLITKSSSSNYPTTETETVLMTSQSTMNKQSNYLGNKPNMQSAAQKISATQIEAASAASVFSLTPCSIAKPQLASPASHTPLPNTTGKSAGMMPLAAVQASPVGSLTIRAVTSQQTANSAPAANSVPKGNLPSPANQGAASISTQNRQRVVMVQENGKFALLPVQDNLPGSFLVTVNNAANVPTPLSLAHFAPQRMPGSNMINAARQAFVSTPANLYQLPKLAPIGSNIQPKPAAIVAKNSPLSQLRGLVDKANQNQSNPMKEQNNGGNARQGMQMNGGNARAGVQLNSVHLSPIGFSGAVTGSKAATVPEAPMVNLPDLQVIQPSIKSAFASKAPSKDTTSKSQSNYVTNNKVKDQLKINSYDTSPHWMKCLSKSRSSLPENLRYSLLDAEDEVVFEDLSRQFEKQSSTTDFHVMLGLFENQFCLKKKKVEPWEFLPQGEDSDFLELLGLDSAIDCINNSYLSSFEPEPCSSNETSLSQNGDDDEDSSKECLGGSGENIQTTKSSDKVINGEDTENETSFPSTANISDSPNPAIEQVNDGNLEKLTDDTIDVTPEVVGEDSGNVAISQDVTKSITKPLQSSEKGNDRVAVKTDNVTVSSDETPALVKTADSGTLTSDEIPAAERTDSGTVNSEETPAVEKKAGSGTVNSEEIPIIEKKADSGTMNSDKTPAAGKTADCGTVTSEKTPAQGKTANCGTVFSEKTLAAGKTADCEIVTLEKTLASKTLETFRDNTKISFRREATEASVREQIEEKRAIFRQKNANRLKKTKPAKDVKVLTQNKPSKKPQVENRQTDSPTSDTSEHDTERRPSILTIKPSSSILTTKPAIGDIDLKAHSGVKQSSPTDPTADRLDNSSDGSRSDDIDSDDEYNMKSKTKFAKLDSSVDKTDVKKNDQADEKTVEIDESKDGSVRTDVNRTITVQTNSKVKNELTREPFVYIKDILL